MKQKYETEKKEFKRKQTLLQDTLKTSGVVTGKSYTNQYKPSPIQVYESTKLDLGTKSKRPTFLDEVENRKKYETMFYYLDFLLTSYVFYDIKNPLHYFLQGNYL